MESQTFYEQARSAFDEGDWSGAEGLLADAIARDPSFVPGHQLLARTYVKLDDVEKAKEILGRREELPKGEHLYGWGQVAEELGLLEEAIGIYMEHLTNVPHHSDSLYRLGLLYLDRGEREKAKAYLLGTTKVDPEFGPAAMELAGLYEEEGLLGLATELYEKVVSLEPGNQEAKLSYELLRDRLNEAQKLPEVQLEPIEVAAKKLLELFSGREGVYARQWIDREGRVGYSPVWEPLTERVLENHLSGDVTVGVYPLRADNAVMFTAIDVDINKNALSRTSDNPEQRKLLESRVMEDVRRLKGMFDHLGLPVHLESSGHKGCHIWTFLGEPIPASQVRLFAQALVKRAGPPSSDLHWEIFPKQDSVEEGQLGNLIKLPLGVHKKTGKRGLFVDADGKIYADQVGYLASVRSVDRISFSRAVEALVGATAEEGAPLEQAELDERYPQLAVVWEKCAVLKALVEKAFTTHHLTNSERLVLKCVFAHLGEQGRELIHAVIRNCLDYSYESTQYQLERTHQNPISCPRIRHHLPELTSSVSCACRFDLPEQGYPSPVLYFDEGFTGGMSRFRSSEVDALVNRYVGLKGRVRKLTRELEQAEGELLSQFQLRETDVITTDNWVIRKPSEDEEIRIELRSG